MVFAYPALIFAKGDVEDPVQFVFDIPVSAHGLERQAGIVLNTIPANRLFLPH